MALTNFFRINMPYGIVKNSSDEWTAFNREYVPIGWNNYSSSQHIDSDQSYADIPIRTKYKNATEELLKALVDKDASPSYDQNGRLRKLFLYSDETNPTNNDQYWDIYFKKILILCSLIVDET